MLRALDILLAIVGLLVLVLLLPLLVVAIRADSSGPAIFRQRRVGRGGTLFTCLKLRTMAAGTREAASHEVGSASVTRIGAFLRRTKLDELPQLWNVLVGEMSFVGPRPCLPTQQAVIECRHRAGVADLRPGITGPAQVSGIDMSEPAALAAADASLLHDGSPSRYFALLLATATGGGQGDAALRHSCLPR